MQQIPGMIQCHNDHYEAPDDVDGGYAFHLLAARFWPGLSI
jgi:hypothetical protein